MGWFWQGNTSPIGIDLGKRWLKLVQLQQSGKGVKLLAGAAMPCPDGVSPSTAEWQRWAIGTIKSVLTDRRFKGRKVVAAMPSSDVFIDNLRIPKGEGSELDQAAAVKVEDKLPFDRANAMVKSMRTENGNVVAVATDRSIVERHLAIYEKASVALESICIWPIAVAGCYAKFFGRRNSDLQAVVLLLDIESDATNLVICRHKNLLYARSLPLGSDSLNDPAAINRLVLEINACKHQFLGMYRNTQIERVIFVSGTAVEATTCAEMARQLEMRAQMGDPLRAVESADVFKCGIDRRNSNVNWATAFGLSLSL